VQHLVEVMLLIFFWASPIVYSISFVNATLHGSLLEEIYLANPVTLAVLGMQKAMWVAGTSDPSQYWPPNLEIRLVVALVVSVFLLWIAQRVFSRLQSNFAQEL
jgi:ABC-2 type transport system permease protein